jgi:hypothetical protein
MRATRMIALINAHPGQDAEFNRWYSLRHVLDAIQTPGLRALRRFVLDGTAPGRKVSHLYLCLYDVMGPDGKADPQGVIDDLDVRRRAGQIPGSDAYDRPGRLVHFYEAVEGNRMSIDPLERTAVLFEAFNPVLSGEAFERDYLERYIPAMTTLPGVAAGELLGLRPETPSAPPRFRYVALYDIEGDPAAVLRALADAQLPKLDIQGDASQGLYRPVTKRITKADVPADWPASAQWKPPK